MQLSEWMLVEQKSIEELSVALNVSISGIRKWIKRERIPRPAMQNKIKALTGNRVTPNDWVQEEQVV